MSLLMIGSFPLMMTIVLMIAVWAERFLAEQDELVPIEENYDKGLDTRTPQAGIAVPAARSTILTKPEL
jgi:hypothetical protein